MSRCFLIEHCRNFDLTPCKEHGDIVYLFPDDHRLSVWHDNFKQDILTRLKEEGFDQRRDFIVCSGGVVPLVQAIGAALYEYGSLRVLFWHAGARVYVPSTLGDIDARERKASLRAS